MADYLLNESPVGYAVRSLRTPQLSLLKPLQIFKVVMQADTVGNRLKEVQDKAQDLAHFGSFYLHLAYRAN